MSASIRPCHLAAALPRADDPALNPYLNGTKGQAAVPQGAAT